MDWTDEVKARLGQVLDSVAATQTVIFPGGAVLRAADIRAALGEIEHFHTVHKWCHRQPTHGKCCTCQACGLDYDSCRCSLDEQVERAEAAEADNERLRDLIVALSEDERGLVTGEVHAEADRIRAALRGGGE